MPRSGGELLAAGYPPSILHLCPNGVQRAVTPHAADALAARAMLADANPELELPAGAVLAVYTGRLEPGCGLEMAVDAWEPVFGAADPTAQLWLAGDGHCDRRSADESNA